MTAGVDAYIRKNSAWNKVLETLRVIILDCDLTEELKWRVPCYTFAGKNVVLLGCLKDCCTLSFLKGALLNDIEDILSKPGKNTRVARLIRFTSVDEVVELQPTLKSYLIEAVELEKSGKRIVPGADRALDIPDELEAKFESDPNFKVAFEL